MSQGAKRQRVLIPTRAAPEMIAALEQHADIEVVAAGTLDAEQLRATLPGAVAVIIRSDNLLDAATLAVATDLRVIGRAGAGVDNVDVDEATRRGIVVLNTPGANARATAEHTLAMMLAAARHIPAAHASLRQGDWKRAAFQGVELRGRTLGLLGVGRVGSIVAEMADALGMHVLACDPVGRAGHNNYELVDLDTLLQRAQVLSIHVPLNEHTRHLIGAEQLRALPRGAIVVQCSRGGVLDEEALCDALDSGHLRGAALDVFEVEPPTGRRVLQQPGIVVTPHLGASTREAQVAVGQRIAEQVVAYLHDGELRDCVNPEAVSGRMGS